MKSEFFSPFITHVLRTCRGFIGSTLIAHVGGGLPRGGTRGVGRAKRGRVCHCFPSAQDRRSRDVLPGVEVSGGFSQTREATTDGKSRHSVQVKGSFGYDVPPPSAPLRSSPFPPDGVVDG